MAATYAIFHHGRPIMSDYTPGQAVSAGDVVAFGVNVRIAHADIAASVKGALAVQGGVYKMPKTANDGGATAGQVAYWNSSTHVITPIAASGTNIFGFYDQDAATADTVAYAVHQPFAGFSGT